MSNGLATAGAGDSERDSGDEHRAYTGFGAEIQRSGGVSDRLEFKVMPPRRSTSEGPHGSTYHHDLNGNIIAIETREKVAASDISKVFPRPVVVKKEDGSEDLFCNTCMKQGHKSQLGNQSNWTGKRVDMCRKCKTVHVLSK